MIEARLAGIAVQETLGVLSPGMINLSLPDHLVSRRGSAIRFTAVARDGQNLPLSVSITGQPINAAFDALTGSLNGCRQKAILGFIQSALQRRVQPGRLQVKQCSLTSSWADPRQPVCRMAPALPRYRLAARDRSPLSWVGSCQTMNTPHQNQPPGQTRPVIPVSWLTVLKRPSSLPRKTG